MKTKDCEVCGNPISANAEEDLGVPMRSARLVETGSLVRYTSKQPC